MSGKLHPEAEELARAAVGVDCAVDATDTEIVIRLWSNRDVERVTFDVLAELARTFRTRAINLRLDGGWVGTEVTPGDPDEFAIVISNWRLPR